MTQTAAKYRYLAVIHRVYDDGQLLWRVNARGASRASSQYVTVPQDCADDLSEAVAAVRMTFNVDDLDFVSVYTHGSEAFTVTFAEKD